MAIPRRAFYDFGMEQKEWEQRLDRVAERVAGSVKEGVRVLENAYEKGKEGVMNEAGGSSTGQGAAPESGAGAPGTGVTKKGSPRLGLALVALGIIWLLHSLGILDQPVFPILLIILGVYFIARSK
ncbi:MAG: hypothetical protein L0Z51_05915 [Candidatus Latescibacteria bacterium]|nr:hypothetical protein [Candidatus Latescibacterota bacterium]